jgi:hypothetical protein
MTKPTLVAAIDTQKDAEYVSDVLFIQGGSGGSLSEVLASEVLSQEIDRSEAFVCHAGPDACLRSVPAREVLRDEVDRTSVVVGGDGKVVSQGDCLDSEEVESEPAKARMTQP